jgi:hypothetical protein
MKRISDKKLTEWLVNRDVNKLTMTVFVSDGKAEMEEHKIELRTQAERRRTIQQRDIGLLATCDAG